MVTWYKFTFAVNLNLNPSDVSDKSTEYFVTNFSSSRSSSAFNYNGTSPKRPHWGQKKVAVVERRP